MNGLLEGHSLLYLILLAFFLIVLIGYRTRRDSINRWLNDRLPSWLSAHGLILIGSVLLLGTIFLVIADHVRDLEATSFDNGFMRLLDRLESPAMDAVMQVFTWSSDTITMVILILAVAAFAFFRKKDRYAAYVLLGISATEGAMVYALKSLYHRTRPEMVEEFGNLQASSFPSGHAMGAAAILGTVALLLVRWYPRSDSAVLVIVPLWVLIIGLSRIYLDTHWPTDVLAGIALGTAYVVVASALLSRKRWPES